MIAAMTVALPYLDPRLRDWSPITIEHAAEDVRDDPVSLLLMTSDAHKIVVGMQWQRFGIEGAGRLPRRQR
jgi:hypothetical protein